MWKRKKDAFIDDYEPTPKENIMYPKMLIAGEQCTRCKRRRTAVLHSTSVLREKIAHYYQEWGGREEGLTVGLVFGKIVEWREVCFIKKKPFKYLSCELQVIVDCF